MFIRDSAAAISQEVTPEGFLRLRARIGRTGLHDYRARELGTPAGFAPDDSIRVFRPPAEVFDPASMASFAGKPVTDEHPPAMIDATNWRRYAIGHSGEGVGSDGDHLAADLYIADAAAAERVRQGAELSNGYHADFLFEPGTTPDGEPYDALQRNIRGNHIALVDAGRCGAGCRIGGATGDAMDTAFPGRAMDEAAVEDGPSSGPSATIAQDSRRDTADGSCECHGRAAPAVLDTAALDTLVVERAAVIDAARRLIGPAFDPAGRTTTAIRRVVLQRRLGQGAFADRSDADVAAAFDTLGALEPRTNPLAAHLALGLADAAGGRSAALAARDHFLAHAWQGDHAHGDL